MISVVFIRLFGHLELFGAFGCDAFRDVSLSAVAQVYSDFSEQLAQLRRTRKIANGLPLMGRMPVTLSALSLDHQIRRFHLLSKLL